MGKSKSRIFRKGANEHIPTISRSDAIKEAIENLEVQDIKKAINIITRFGLEAEELLEAGASYETVMAVKNILK